MHLNIPTLHWCTYSHTLIYFTKTHDISCTHIWTLHTYVCICTLSSHDLIHIFTHMCITCPLHTSNIYSHALIYIFKHAHVMFSLHPYVHTRLHTLSHTHTTFHPTHMYTFAHSHIQINTHARNIFTERVSTYSHTLTYIFTHTCMIYPLRTCVHLRTHSSTFPHTCIWNVQCTHMYTFAYLHAPTYRSTHVHIINPLHTSVHTHIHFLFILWGLFVYISSYILYFYMSHLCKSHLYMSYLYVSYSFASHWSLLTYQLGIYTYKNGPHKPGIMCACVWAFMCVHVRACTYIYILYVYTCA